MSPQDVSKKLVPVYMDELDGDGFTDHMVRVYEKLGYDGVQRTRRGGDGGKDIVMYRGRDLYYVECKHWREHRVGRPDVQKLDSAAYRAGATHAFLVATVHFSPQAIEYADQMRGMTVELIDRDKLLDMNEEAGYRLIFGVADDVGREDAVFCCPSGRRWVAGPELGAWLQKVVDQEGTGETVPPGRVSSCY